MGDVTLLRFILQRRCELASKGEAQALQLLDLSENHRLVTQQGLQRLSFSRFWVGGDFTHHRPNIKASCLILHGLMMHACHL